MSFVKTESKGFVKIITIDRPEALNALNNDVVAELEKAIDGVNPDETRCVVITGGGEKAFVAGADIGTLIKQKRQEAKTWSRYGQSVFRKIETLAVPVIAAVNGFAFGGGAELAMACDIRLVSDTAVFALPEAGLAIVPGFGGTQRLPRLVGAAKAKELLFTGSRVKAEEALRLGLANAVFPSGELMAEAVKMADRIASNGPIAVRQIKKAVNEGIQTDIDSATALEAEYSSLCFETADQQNAMTAFFEKRKPEPFINK
jgi:enoyl-CoA hydratase